MIVHNDVPDLMTTYSVHVYVHRWRWTSWKNRLSKCGEVSSYTNQ